MERLLHLFAAGGFMMYPLVLASIAAVAIAVNRSSLYKKSRANLALLTEKLPAILKSRDFEGAAKVSDQAGGSAGSLVAEACRAATEVENVSEFLSGRAAHEAGRLKALLNYVSAIVTLSPLMGLLGTVLGMIRSFDVLSISEGQPFAITGGVAEALVATGFGLFVAILAMLIHVWLTQWANKLIAEIEAAASLFLASLPSRE